MSDWIQDIKENGDIVLNTWSEDGVNLYTTRLAETGGLKLNNRWYEGQYDQECCESADSYLHNRNLEVFQEFVWNDRWLYCAERDGALHKIFADGEEAKLWLELLLRDVPAERERRWVIIMKTMTYSAFD